MKPQVRLQALLADFAHFPWRATLLTLRGRFREDQMGLTASSLTFTTSIALVPFFTVVLAVFTAFPMFAKFQGALQAWLIESLIPDTIARQVLGYLTLFSRQANKLGVVGLAVLLLTAITLILTIDRTLNNIWRVKVQRPLAQRVLIYWAVITLVPLLLAASLAVSSYVLSASRGVVGSLPVSLRFLLDILQFTLMASGLATLYRYVPNTHVKWIHAWAGGVFVAVGIEVAKKLLGFYLTNVPTYSMIYGAFATVPILLVWIYVAWIIVLMGAAIAAYLPSLLAGAERRGTTDGAKGWQFQLAIEALGHLHSQRSTSPGGCSADVLAQRLQVDVLQLEPVLQRLAALQWVGQLAAVLGGAQSIHAKPGDTQPRYVLLAEPDNTRLEPLVQLLLLDKTAATLGLWQHANLATLTLRQVL